MAPCGPLVVSVLLEQRGVLLTPARQEENRHELGLLGLVCSGLELADMLLTCWGLSVATQAFL